MAEDPLEVSRLGEIVPTSPPDVEQRERQLDEPDDSEAEHSEEHSRADWTRGRLARESVASARVNPERPEQHDLRQHPRAEEEPLDVDSLVDETAPKDRVHVDQRRCQIGRNNCLKQDGGAGDPGGDGHRDQAETERPAQAGSASGKIGVWPSRARVNCSSRGSSRRTGAECG